MASGLGLGSRLIRLLTLFPDSHGVNANLDAVFESFEDDVSAQFGSGDSNGGGPVFEAKDGVGV